MEIWTIIIIIIYITLANNKLIVINDALRTYPCAAPPFPVVVYIFYVRVYYVLFNDKLFYFFPILIY